MIRRLAYSFTFLCTVLALQPICAQERSESPLVLTGTVVNSRTFCYKGQKPLAAIELLMQFRNDGSEPIIVVKPPSLLFDLNVTYSDGTSTKSLTYNPYNLDNPFRTTITRDDFDYRPVLFEKIGTSPNIIEPGRFLEFRDTVLVSSGFRFEAQIEKEHPSECSDAKPPVPQHQSFSLEYRIPVTREPSANVDVFNKLQERFREKGKFILNNGEVLYRSQVITIQLEQPDQN